MPCVLVREWNSPAEKKKREGNFSNQDGWWKERENPNKIAIIQVVFGIIWNYSNQAGNLTYPAFLENESWNVFCDFGCVSFEEGRVSPTMNGWLCGKLVGECTRCQQHMIAFQGDPPASYTDLACFASTSLSNVFPMLPGREMHDIWPISCCHVAVSCPTITSIKVRNKNHGRHTVDGSKIPNNYLGCVKTSESWVFTILTG